MPPPLTESLPSWLLGRAHARAQQLLQHALEPSDLRPLHARAILAVDERGELSQTELGQALGLDRKDVSQAVDLLGDRGLAERRPDPEDRRRRLVTLTDAGRALASDLAGIFLAVQDELLAPLTADERAELVRLLARIREPQVAAE